MNAAVKTEQMQTLDLQPIAEPLPVVQKPAPVVAVNSPAALMLQAMSQGASLEQVGKMMDLQERWEEREALKAFNAAFAAFKAEAIEVLKRKRVSFNTSKGKTEYSHAELSDVVDAVTPHLSKHGLSISWKPTKQERNWVEVTCTLKHIDGHSETVTLGAAPDDSGGKNAIQAVGSAVTYLERYTAKAILGVAEKGQDDDGAGGTKEERPEIAAWKAAAAKGDAALRAHYNANVPTQEFWNDHSPDLKAAARKADQERAR